MKKIFIGILTLVVLASCNKKVVQPTTTAIPPKKTTPKPVGKEGEQFEPVPDAAATVQLTFARGACYGKCPQYKITLLTNGWATYEGVANTPRVGKFRARVSEELWAKIEKRANEMQFFSLKPKYPSEGWGWIADAPTTTTVIKIGSQNHQIEDNNDAPVSLIEFEKFLEQSFEALYWKIEK